MVVLGAILAACGGGGDGGPGAAGIDGVYQPSFVDQASITPGGQSRPTSIQHDAMRVEGGVVTFYSTLTCGAENVTSISGLTIAPVTLSCMDGCGCSGTVFSIPEFSVNVIDSESNGEPTIALDSGIDDLFDVQELGPDGAFVRQFRFIAFRENGAELQ